MEPFRSLDVVRFIEQAGVVSAPQLTAFTEKSRQQIHRIFTNLLAKGVIRKIAQTRKTGVTKKPVVYTLTPEEWYLYTKPPKATRKSVQKALMRAEYISQVVGTCRLVVDQDERSFILADFPEFHTTWSYWEPIIKKEYRQNVFYFTAHSLESFRSKLNAFAPVMTEAEIVILALKQHYIQAQNALENFRKKYTQELTLKEWVALYKKTPDTNSGFKKRVKDFVVEISQDDQSGPEKLYKMMGKNEIKISVQKLAAQVEIDRIEKASIKVKSGAIIGKNPSIYGQN